MERSGRERENSERLTERTREMEEIAGIQSR